MVEKIGFLWTLQPRPESERKGRRRNHGLTVVRRSVFSSNNCAMNSSRSCTSSAKRQSQSSPKSAEIATPDAGAVANVIAGR